MSLKSSRSKVRNLSTLQYRNILTGYTVAPRPSHSSMHSIDPELIAIQTDWDDAQTDLAHLGGTAPGSAKSGGDKLWEDNWDDDDVEDEFSVQLR